MLLISCNCIFRPCSSNNKTIYRIVPSKRPPPNFDSFVVFEVLSVTMGESSKCGYVKEWYNLQYSKFLRRLLCALLKQIASTIVVEKSEGCLSVSVAQTSPEIFRERQLFQFLPFGLSTAPPVFTKVIKQVMSFRLLCSSERRIWHMPELSLTRQWYLSIHSHRCEFVKNWNGKAIWHQYLRWQLSQMPPSRLGAQRYNPGPWSHQCT